MIARVLLAVLALAAAAWVGTSLHSAQLVSEAATELVGRQPSGEGLDLAALGRRGTPERLNRGADLLERARKWAPYQAPITTEAGLLFAAGRKRRAVELCEELVRREPDNPEAWATLARLVQNSDPARSEQARRRLRELTPPVRRR